jgi:hypothetical protein
MAFRDKFRGHKDAYMLSKGLVAGEPVPEIWMNGFKDYLAQHIPYGDVHRTYMLSLERPRAAKNKRSIVSWMCYWPFSVVGTVLNDPVRRLFSFLFKSFKALYQKLSDHVFRNEMELK